MKALGIAILAACTLAAQTKDWGGLIRYGSDNAELRTPKLGEDRVVFLGDQVTELWSKGAAAFFPGKPFLNRGIAGQTSAQMLVRFHQDVVALKPKVVVIQAGVNDLLVATEGVVADNYMSMMDIAKANGIRVVLASVTPVCDCYIKQTGLRPQGKIISLNGWIRDFAASSGTVYLNYYAALADGRNFKKELTDDGLLPNAAAYAIMTPLAEKAIAEALSKPVVGLRARSVPYRSLTVAALTAGASQTRRASQAEPRPLGSDHTLDGAETLRENKVLLQIRKDFV